MPLRIRTLKIICNLMSRRFLTLKRNWIRLKPILNKMEIILMMNRITIKSRAKVEIEKKMNSEVVLPKY